MVQYRARKCEMRNAKSWQSMCSDVGWSSFCKGVFFSSLVIWSSSVLQQVLYTTLLPQKLVENRDSWTQTMSTVMQAIEHDIELC
jgi:hypothetical protein